MAHNLLLSVVLFFVVSFSSKSHSTSSSDSTEQHDQVSRYINNNYARIEGWQSHGMNVFNTLRIANLSEYALLANIPTRLIAIWNKNGDEEKPIDANTDRDGIISTTREWIQLAQHFNPSIITNPEWFNIPYLDIGALSLLSNNLTQRYQYNQFEDIMNALPSDITDNGRPYLPKGAIRYPTLNDWEKISGLLEVQCVNDRSGPATVTITICNALPMSLYSAWLIGVKYPGKDKFYAMKTQICYPIQMW
eukprot:267362_1